MLSRAQFFGIKITLCGLITLTSQISWPQVAFQIAHSQFQNNCLLIIRGPGQNATDIRRPLIQQNNVNFFELLNTELSIFVSDDRFKPPPEEVGYFNVRKAQLILILLNKQMVEQREAFSAEVQKWVSNPAWYGRASIVVVIEGGGREESQIVVSELWRQVKAAHVVVITSKGQEKELQDLEEQKESDNEEEETEIELFSWVPYNPMCIPEIVSLGFWRKNFLINQSLFLSKNIWNLNNLNGCELLVGSTEIMPYVAFNFTGGSDIIVFDIIAKKMNFSYRYIRCPPGENPWVAVDPNGIPTGLIGVLHRREADLLLHGVQQNWDRFRFSDTIGPYCAGDLVWVAPQVEKLPSYLTFFYIFDNLTWLGASLILLLVPALLTLLTEFSVGHTILFTWSMTVGTSIPFPSPKLIQRIFLSFFFLYVLILSVGFQAGMIKVLTNGVLITPTKSAEEAAEKGYNLSMFHSVIPQLIGAHPKFFKYITSRNLVTFSENYLISFRRMAKGSREISLVADIVTNYEINLRFTTKTGKKMLRHLKNRFSPFETVLMMSRDHPLTPAIKKMVHSLVEGGIFQYAINWVLLDASSSKMSEVEDEANFGGLKVLGIEHLYAAFLIWAICLILASFMFLFELLHKYGSGKFFNNEKRASSKHTGRRKRFKFRRY